MGTNHPPDCLLRLTPEEAANVEPLSGQVIQDALERGRVEAESFLEALPTPRDDGRFYR